MSLWPGRVICDHSPRMPWQVLYSVDDMGKPEPRKPAPQSKPLVSTLDGPVRVKPVSLTIRADGSVQRTRDEDDDLD